VSAPRPTERRDQGNDFIERVTLPAEIKPYIGLRAGLVSRGMACGIDLVAIAVIVAAIFLGIVGVRFAIRPAAFTMPDFPQWLTVSAPFIVAIVYFAGSWQASGRTLGDQVLGLRVVNRHGRALAGWVALVRAVLCVFFPIGLAWTVVSGQNRSVQDLIVRTSVIHDWRTREDFTSPRPVT
jgi:uncharacterized RDD family membrane protein YckC